MIPIVKTPTTKDFFNIAKIIDNDFIGSEETFTSERKNGYYYLTTNKCDDASLIKVYCNFAKIDKIERLGSDTETYQEIYPKTYDNIREYIKNLTI